MTTYRIRLGHHTSIQRHDSPYGAAVLAIDQWAHSTGMYADVWYCEYLQKHPSEEIHVTELEGCKVLPFQRRVQ